MDDQANDTKPRSRTSRMAKAAGAILLLLLLLWRCGHDGVPSGSPATGPANAGRAPVCDGLLEHKAWTGRITYAHARDVTDPEGRFRVRYDYDVDVEARMVERTRRTNRGKDYLVQVFSPSPAGRIKAVQKLEDFNSQGLLESHEFTATGGVNEFEEGMSETGSMMSLTVNDDCSYRVFLQAQAMGKGKAYDRYKGAWEYDGMLGIPSVRGEGIATSGSTISGTFELPALSERVLERNRSNPDWDSFHYVIERDRVAEVLGDDNLGTVKVSWHFEAAD